MTNNIHFFFSPYNVALVLILRPVLTKLLFYQLPMLNVITRICLYNNIFRKNKNKSNLTFNLLWMINDWKLCGIYKFIVHTTTIFVLNIEKYKNYVQNKNESKNYINIAHCKISTSSVSILTYIWTTFKQLTLPVSTSTTTCFLSLLGVRHRPPNKLLPFHEITKI